RHGGKRAVLREAPSEWTKLTREWTKLTRQVAALIRLMPLWKLQTVRGRSVEFLYPNRVLVQGAIDLYPGVAYKFRRFHGLIQDLVHAAWVRFVRSLPANQAVLGQTQDLAEFMFGSERANLDAYAEVLREVDGNTCFYCQHPTNGSLTWITSS